MENRDDYAAKLAWFLTGAVIGASVAILFAPKSGKETRQEIREGAEELLEKAKGQYEEASSKIEKLVGLQKEALHLKKEKLKKAVECGVDAFKEEKTAVGQA